MIPEELYVNDTCLVPTRVECSVDVRAYSMKRFIGIRKAEKYEPVIYDGCDHKPQRKKKVSRIL